MHLVVSLEEARKIMGEDADKLTDEQLEDVIILLQEIARAAIKDGRKQPAGEA